MKPTPIAGSAKGERGSTDKNADYKGNLFFVRPFVIISCFAGPARCQSPQPKNTHTAVITAAIITSASTGHNPQIDWTPSSPEMETTLQQQSTDIAFVTKSFRPTTKRMVKSFNPPTTPRLLRANRLPSTGYHSINKVGQFSQFDMQL